VKPSKRRKWLVVLLGGFLAAFVLIAVGTRHYQRAAAVWLRVEGAKPPLLLRWSSCEVEEQLTVLPGGIRGRLYLPKDRNDAPAMVVLHGVHHLGIDEPRLRGFARALAEGCLKVLTPQLSSLVDYRIEPSAIDEIGAATTWLSGQAHRRAGILGLSFAGGLALAAAADPRYSDQVAMVVAVGAHSDLSRVARFFVTGQSELPDGRVQALEPQQYGALVLAFAHPEVFFPKKEIAQATDCMRLWLWEEFAQARTCGNGLSPGSNVMMEALFQYQIERLRSRLLLEIERDKETMARVSPTGRLSAIRVPVFLLHGERDGVIPPAETMWLAQELPQKYLRRVLISPAVGHVDPEQTSLRDQWKLGSFLAAVLRESDRVLPTSKTGEAQPSSR
jgi:pimeloyl-ACP methyl ester carboxylesterase